MTPPSKNHSLSWLWGPRKRRDPKEYRKGWGENSELPSFKKEDVIVPANHKPAYLEPDPKDYAPKPQRRVKIEYPEQKY